MPKILRFALILVFVALLGVFPISEARAQSVSQYASGWTASGTDWTPMPPSMNPLGPPDAFCVGTSNAGEVWAQFTFPSFGIPAVNTIVGIEVNVNYRSVVSPTMTLRMGGGQIGMSRMLPATPVGPSTCNDSLVRTAGGPMDTWGAGLTPADFNSAGTVAVRLTRVTGPDMPVSIDIESVQLVVYHQNPNHPPDCSGAAIATQNADASCQATISGADVTGVTDPDGDMLTIMVSPTVLSLGANNVTVSADDGRGGTCMQEINVEVVDVTSPVITLLGPNPLTLECNIDMYSDPGATVTDNCDMPTVMVGGDTVDESTLGTYIVTYDATDDSGNAATQLTRTVNVVDTTPPVITLNGDAMVTLECGVDTYTELGATASDVCDPSVPVTIGGDTVDEGTPGTYIVTYDAQDDSGNMAVQVTRTVVVQDTLPPVIECNAPPTIVPPDAPISFTATAEDACDGTLIPEVTGYACFFTNPSGRLVDKRESCVVSFMGPTLTIDDSGGVRDTIQWTVTAEDEAGNVGMETCSVLVVNPGKSAALLDPFEVEFPLESDQTVPDTGSEASGRCVGRFNASRSKLSLSCRHDLPQTSLRVNHGPAGQNGELLREIGPVGRQTEQKLDLSDSIEDLYSGELYLTAPSERFPDGEIRGQIPAPPRILSFAQFGSGEGFSSELALHNPSRTKKVSGYVRILDADGEPLEMTLVGGEASGVPSSVTEFEIPPLGGLTLSAAETVGLTEGSAIVVSDGLVAGLVRFTIPGLGVASVPGSRPFDEAIAPVSSKQGFATGIAIQNVDQRSITIHLSLRNADGVEAVNGAAVKTLEPGARVAQFLSLLFPDADLRDFSGELVIRSEGGSFSAIAMELGERAGQLTTLPVTPIER